MVDILRNLLSNRGANMGEDHVRSSKRRMHRAGLTRAISQRYRIFDDIRQVLASAGPGATIAIEDQDPAYLSLLNMMVDGGFAKRHGPDYELPTDSSKVRYLSGGWLEELACDALLEAGADAAVCGQSLQWSSGPYQGISEVDVIGRRKDRMLFVSCKSAKPDLMSPQESIGKSQRTRLMRYLHEADNIADHFGAQNALATLIVTTDLIDEDRGYRPRYETLFGKALALNVELVSLEDVAWERMVARFRAVL